MNAITRTQALALRPGDLVKVVETTYVVIARPKQHGGRPLMIVARPANDPNANARNLQFGHHRIELG
jgi:hypothetical protein